jgi:hypothetical protein
MILNFVCADTAAVFAGKKCKRFVNIRTVAERKLQQLDSAATLEFPTVATWQLLGSIGKGSCGSTQHTNQ